MADQAGSGHARTAVLTGLSGMFRIWVVVMFVVPTVMLKVGNCASTVPASESHRKIKILVATLAGEHATERKEEKGRIHESKGSAGDRE